MVKTSQTAVGLAEDDSESSAEFESSSNSGDSAEMTTRLDTSSRLTAAECDATWAIQDDTVQHDTRVDGGLALDSDDDDEYVKLAYDE